MSEIVPTCSRSPFDAIKRTDAGGEHWDGREYMPLLDYDKWERFADVIEKARTAIVAAGGDPDAHASRLREASGRTQRGNYRLTRYGCYMVAMSAEGSKPAVAQAKTYFAVRTREAETAPAAALPDMATAEGALAVLDMLRDQIEARIAAENVMVAERAGREIAEQRNAELEPKAAAADALMESEGAVSMGAVANAFKIGRQALFDLLREEKIIQKDRRPYQDYADWFRVTVRHYDDSNGIPRPFVNTRMYPAGALRLHALLAKRGHDLCKPVFDNQLSLLDGGAA